MLSYTIHFTDHDNVNRVEFNDTPKFMSQATSMGSFAQFFGGTIGLGIAEPIFSSTLNTNLLKYAPNAPPEIVKEAPTAIYSALSPDLIPGVVESYTQSLRLVFILGVPVGALRLSLASYDSFNRLAF